MSGRADPAGERSRAGAEPAGPRRVDLRPISAAAYDPALRDELATAHHDELRAAVRAARLVCFPTDTVYGVGGALTPAVAAALVVAKGRDPGKPLQVVFPTLAALEAAVAMDGPVLGACRRLLPGPVTLLLPYPAGWTFPPPGSATWEADGRVEAIPTLGVRVPAWPPPASVMSTLGLPLVASSANPSGSPAPASLGAVDAHLLAQCDLVLDAGTMGGAASSVIDLSRYAQTGRWRLVRAGALPAAEVAARLASQEERLS